MQLADFCETIVDCKHKTAPTQDTGFPSIRTPNIGRGYFLLDNVNRVSEETYRLWTRRTVPKQGDLIMAREAPVGNVAMIPEGLQPCLGQRTLLIRPDRSKIESRYLVYLLIGEEVQATIRAMTNGVTVPHLNMEDVRALELPDVPPLSVQRRIAGILSAYDDLIENNLRRIRILEKMARSLYREWFVHFQFAGNEGVPRVDSSLGPIPEGWEIKKLREIALVNRAQINPRTAPEQIHYIDISSVSPSQIDNITTYAFSEAPGRARRLVRHGDVIWSCVRPNRRSHALVIQPEADTIASTGFAVLTATQVPFPFLYFATTTDEFVAFLTNNATGAAYPAVTASTFENADLLIPSAPLLKKFGDFAIPVAGQIDKLQRKNKSLRSTRDLLLPRLISRTIFSGTIDVSSADLSTASDGNKKSMVTQITATQKYPTAVAVPGDFRGSADVLSTPVGANTLRLVQPHAEDNPDANDEHPPPIDQTDRSDALAAIRQVFSDSKPRTREDAIREVARALGYGRTGHRIQDVLHTDLLTAVRRGILDNVEDELILLARSIAGYDRDLLKQQFLAALGRSWVERNDAIQNFCRWMGFRRTGQIIDETARSVINGLLRESRLEANGPNLIRRTS